MNLNSTTLADARLAPVACKIAAAAIDPRQWIWALAELQKLHSGAQVAMFSHDLRTDMSLDLLHVGYDPMMIDSYREYYGGVNVWAAGFGKFRPGEVKCCAAVHPEESLLATEFYNDWLRPQEDIRGGAGMVAPLGNGRVVAIAGNIRNRDRSRIEAQFTRDLTALSPFLIHALQANRMLSDHAEESQRARLGIDTAEVSVLVLRDDRRLVYANAHGQAMLNANLHLGLDILNRLCFTNPRAHGKLARALFDLRHCEPGLALPFFVTAQSQAPALMCRALQFRGNDCVDAPFPFLDQSRDYLALIIAPAAATIAAE